VADFDDRCPLGCDLPYLHISKKSEISENPPNPLKKGAKIGFLVPLFKGDLGGLRSRTEVKQTCVYTVVVVAEAAIVQIE
jgi:hypothetical protein